ncbi:MAG: hypothetical protein MUE44_21645 [Oscillatoriaceae cyanobacterium Prado104]|jgi:hypothetical protein|nr:hypothetical protein [Oscillatoriaceae cyanobacterium Prado104]
MIRRYITNLSTNIFKRACATAAVLVLTGGCSPPKPPINAATSSAIAPLAQTQPPQPVVAQNPNKPKKSVSAPSCPQNDPFAESISFATQAANLAQSANSKQDWDEVAALWVQAVAWMQAVPPSNPRRAFAEKKVMEYMRNLTYSQQQAGASRSSASTVSFSSDLLDEQLELYLSYVAAVGPPDVLIVGSSRALQGVDPKQLKQSLGANGRPGLKVFNFGVNGATAQVVDFQLRRLLKPDHLPQMILWADGVRAFNSGREDRTFDSIVDSEGNKLLVAGVRPKLASNQPNAAPQCYSFPEPCANPIFHRARASLASNSLQGGYFARPTSSLPVAISVTAQRGQLIPLAPSGPVALRRVSELADSIDSNGFMPLSARYNPNTYYRDRAYVAGRYDRDYEDFNLGGKQAKAFNSVVAFAKTRKIPLVFVSLPVTDDYLDGTRRWAEQQFRQRMQQLSRSQGFMFRDLSQRWPNRNDLFVDPSHLNRFGAIAVSRQIAADDSIPWPSPRSRSSDG